MNAHVVNFKGKQYTVNPMASGTLWRLTEIGAERNSIVMNRDDMARNGLFADPIKKPVQKGWA